MSLVEEIQAGALNREIPVIDLLRRVKLAAAKLKLSDTQEWVERELYGYAGAEDTDIPAYRVASGSLMHFTPYHGTQPAHGDPESIAAMSVHWFREPIGALESSLTLSGDRVVLPINIHMAKLLAANGFNGNYSIHFSKNVIVSITDAVRNLVLDWAIKLEVEGIMGEGVSFTMEEKERAAHTASNIQINNYGHFHQGDTHGHQNRTTVNGTDLSNNSLSIDVWEQLQSAVTSNIDNAADRDVLLDLIKQMKEKKGTAGFKEAYTSFLVSAANHMTVIAPFLPAIAAYLPA